MTARDETKGQAACEQLKREGLNVVFHQLDVTDDKSIQRLPQFTRKESGRLDILVNNAGVFLDKGTLGMNVDLDIVRQTTVPGTHHDNGRGKGYARMKKFERIPGMSSLLQEC